MTITDRRADPAFQQLLKRAHPKWWASGERVQKFPVEIAEAILREICDGKPTETHPEYRALVSALDRAQIADLCVETTAGE